jgi:hypothetical protein
MWTKNVPSHHMGRFYICSQETGSEYRKGKGSTETDQLVTFHPVFFEQFEQLATCDWLRLSYLFQDWVVCSVVKSGCSSL